ncbi:MAG: His/Gly/Thr/Pro-type tRNA ligase C-terminal domain-containing protein, partial [Actinomycetota bacterium]
VWPAEIAPAKVHIVATGKEDLPFTTAEKVALELEGKGIEVMLDDRREASPGVKFKDAELIGNPVILIFGKSLADGKVELRIRKSGEKSEVALAEVVSKVAALLS